jgi:hypothetical protein
MVWGLGFRIRARVKVTVTYGQSLVGKNTYAFLALMKPPSFQELRKAKSTVDKLASMECP